MALYVSASTWDPEETIAQTQAAAKRSGADRQANPEQVRPGGKAKSPDIVEFSKEQELAAYRDMLLIRRFEEKAGQLYGMGMIGGFCHLYIGQEAVVIGMKMAMS